MFCCTHKFAWLKDIKIENCREIPPTKLPFHVRSLLTLHLPNIIFIFISLNPSHLFYFTGVSVVHNFDSFFLLFLFAQTGPHRLCYLSTRFCLQKKKYFIFKSNKKKKEKLLDKRRDNNKNPHVHTLIHRNYLRTNV